VHALVPTVLLGMTGLDPFRADPQPHPPHGELGESADRGRGKRRTVVGANRFRQTKLGEGGLEDRAYFGLPRPLDRLDAEYRPGATIGDRQRMAPGSAGLEVALEVGAPNIIGSIAAFERG
jgi:hypothetical protein